MGKRQKWSHYEKLLFIARENEGHVDDIYLDTEGDNFPDTSHASAYLTPGSSVAGSNWLDINETEENSGDNSVNPNETHFYEESPALSVASKRSLPDFDENFGEEGKNDTKSFNVEEPFQIWQEKESSNTVSQEDETDGDLHFFKSLLPMLKQLDDIEKIEFRMNVQDSLLQFLKRKRSNTAADCTVTENKVFTK